MKVLLVHNTYQQAGGEDMVFESEADLLESHGHRVVRELYDNRTIPARPSLTQSIRLSASTVWSRTSARRLRQVIREFRPDVAHFHNTFPLVSPSAYSTCQDAGVPVVQTLHNYRLLCSHASFYRDGMVCEECLGRRITWPGVMHGCYRESKALSANVSTMQLAHREIGIRRGGVNAYIALSETSRQIFIRGGIPAERITVKPNFLPSDLGIGSHQGGFALFVGRLSREKGVHTLLEAWERFQPRIPLKIVGDGPLDAQASAAADRNSSIEWLGRQPRQTVIDLLGDAAMLVFPSECHETFGLTVIEAFSRGTPVVVSRLGTPKELVTPDVTGVQFSPGNPEELACAVERLACKPGLSASTGANARRLFECEFTAEKNYEQLIEVYRQAIAHRKSQSSTTTEDAGTP